MPSPSLALILPVLDPDALTPATVGDLLQLLVAYGDDRFVAEIGRMAEHRLRWILERDSRPLS